jgi:ArsR family transcriptional regulator, zinc-responsive transcriptional repressor
MPKPIPAKVLERCAASLKVLAHPARLRIVELVAERRLTVGELALALGEPQAVVSQHLIRMRAVDLLSVEREGRMAYYRVANPSCSAVLDCIRAHFV